MNYICMIFGSIFYIAGALFAFSNLYSYLSVWKALSQEEQAGIKIKALCKNIGAMIAFCGLIFFAKGFSSVISNQLFTIIIIFWFILAGLDVLYIEKSSRYKNA